MFMLAYLIPSSLWILAILGMAFAIMMRILALRFLLVIIIGMVLLPVAGPILFGMLSDIFRILACVR